MSAERFETFEAFWPFYLREHSLLATRRWHYVGTAIAAVLIVQAVANVSPLLLLAAPIPGYACAWYSHFFIERNRPATFIYPVWSFLADWKMAFLALTGQLEPELRRAGVTS